MAGLQEKLRGLLGAKFVPDVPLAQYLVDGREPGVVVQLAKREEISNLIEWSHNHGLAIIPWGGGTAMSIGNVPTRYDIALDLSHTNRLIEYSPEDMTVTAEAGMTLGELQRRLAKHGQFLPIEAPDEATIGGIIASNRYGPSRLAWGMVRDWLIGVRFVRGDGKLIHGGGKVVKNVAGYDMCKLLVGSYGTLGVIIEATFKVSPVPEARCTCVDSLPHLAHLNTSPLRPQFVELVNSAAGKSVGLDVAANDSLLIGFSGTREEVDWQVSELKAARIEFSPSAMNSFGAKADVLLRIVGQFSEMGKLHQQIVDVFGDDLMLTAHANLCVFRCALSMSKELPKNIQRIRDKYQIVIERGPLELKKAINVWGKPGTSISLAKKIKEELDPHAILNPGRFVGGI